MSTLNNRNSERALILAPLGRDAQIAAQILDEAGIESHPCPDLSCFVEELHAGAGFAVVTEDVLRDIDPLAVRQWISAQPSWSDLPILVLTAKGGGIERNPHARRLTEVLGNVVFLERPFHPTTFVSVARTALRGRRRQYRSRDDQDEIAESETRLRFALDAGHLGSWEFDLATRTLLCSRICKSNFGRQPHEVFTYEHLLSSIHPEDQARITAAVNKAIAEGGDYQVEYRIIWPNGTLHWIEVRGRRLISFDGDVTLLGVSLDITARREAEIALRLSEERYRTLIEALPQLVWTCLPDGRCNYLNRQWIEFTGVESSDPLDVNWLDVVHPLDRDRIREHWCGAKAERHPYDIEYRIRRHDGLYHWFKARGIPIRDSARHIALWFGTCTNIQDIVEAREVLTRDTEQLARLVGERTAALEASMNERAQVEEALRQSQKMEAVGQLTGGIAHDFNNLLQVITGGLEIMRFADDRPRREKLLEGMRRAADRGSQLTKQLLAFSRKQTLKPQSVDLRHQIIAMRELLDRSLRGDIRIETHFSEDLWPVEVDPTQMELSVINIAVNARDAMPRGGTLSIVAENKRINGADFVRLAFIDNGIGMSPDTVKRIFEPFYTTKDVGKGSGLGLPQVYGFAQQSGGDVEVESQLNVGTTVTLFLPRSERDSIIPAVSDISATNHKREQTDDAYASVLLVEDDDEVAALATEMLTQLGYGTTRVSTAAAALGALANDRQIDLVFTDIMMPGGMSGAELAHEIRKRRPDLPIVLTTGYDGDALVEAQSEDIPLLRKPYCIEALSSILNEVVRTAYVTPTQQII